MTVCHGPIAWLRNWRDIFREIRWRWTLTVLSTVPKSVEGKAKAHFQDAYWCDSPFTSSLGG